MTAMRSAAEQPMSAAEQFKAAVTSEAVPLQGWRGGLERSSARRGSGQEFPQQLIVEKIVGARSQEPGGEM